MLRWCMATCGCPGKTLPLAFVLVGPNLRKHDAIRLGSSSQAAQPTDRGRIWSRKGDETPHVPIQSHKLGSFLKPWAFSLQTYRGRLGPAAPNSIRRIATSIPTLKNRSNAHGRPSHARC